MGFWMFVLYLAGAIIVLVAGWFLFQYGLGWLARGTFSVVDGAHRARTGRAMAKWELIEAELDDEDSSGEPT